MNTGFIIGTHPNNPRLTIVMINQMVIKNFCMQVNDISIQAIEYKPFLRFKIANILDEATGKTLGEGLRNTLKFRPSGAVLIGCETEDYLTLESIERNVFHVLLSTAISHLVGLPNLDSMSGKFYARFTVKHTDDSDSYLRQAYRRLELHTDGTFVAEEDMSGVGNLNTASGLMMGADLNGAYQYNGSLAEVRIWETLLSDEDIAAWACLSVDSSHPNWSSLASYWKMDDNDDYLSNSSPNNPFLDAFVNGAEWQIADSTIIYDV